MITHILKNQDIQKELFFLILSCSGGAGHLRAAEALHRTADRVHLPIRTEHYDILDFTSKLFKRLYSGSYLQMVNRAPELWGYLYQQSEKRSYQKKGLLKTFDEINYKRYIATLEKLSPDAILCTHFLPYISISNTIEKAKIFAPFFAVTTDFDIHQLWIDNIIQHFYVFHEESAWQLKSKNIAPNKITVAGIPVMPEFLEEKNTGAAKKKLHIQPSSFTILVSSGGFGIGRMKETVASIKGTVNLFPKKHFNLLIVCGKNEKLKSEMELMMYPSNVLKKIYGFVSNIQDFMSASDVLISKAGGLTSSEAMAKSLPMLIIDPIPGQESRNADIILEHGAGWKAINMANLTYKLKNIIERPSILQSAKKATETLAKPHAAEVILRDVYERITKGKEYENFS